MTARPARVLHLLVAMPLGGLELQLLNIMRRYDRRRFTPVLCCIRELGELGLDARREGIETHVLGRMRTNRFDPVLIPRLARLLREQKIDLLRTLQYHCNAYGRVAAALAGTPVVCSVHQAVAGSKWHRRLVNRLLAGRTDAIVAVSAAARDLMLREDRVPPDLVRVIHNGVDMKAFSPATDKAGAKLEAGLDPGQQVVVNVARLSGQKGQRYLVEALALSRVRPKCAIVGAGPEESALRDLAARLGLGDRVLFPGASREVQRWLRAADLYAFPSLWEGLGNAFIEAMACGLPSVASDLPCLREIATPKEAVFVPPEDAAALAEAIDGLLEDGVRMAEMGAAARRRAEKNFSIERTVRAYQDLYDELLARRNAA